MKKLDNQEEVDDSSNDEKRNKNKILTHHDEQINLKNEFKIAAKEYFINTGKNFFKYDFV